MYGNHRETACLPIEGAELSEQLAAAMEHINGQIAEVEQSELCEREPAFISADPNVRNYSYDTVIGEDGARLSGGEKQRISIARALLKDAPILLLDEVTANVDIENERKIQLALQELLQNRTVVIIAHKLSTLRRVEQILVIENGGISMRGTHAELMAQDGLYKRLWNKQYETGKWRV